MKGRNQNILMLVAVAALIFLLFNMNSKSDYSINEREYSMFAPTAGPAAGPAAGPSAAGNTVCPRGYPQGSKLPRASCSGWFP